MTSPLHGPAASLDTFLPRGLAEHLRGGCAPASRRELSVLFADVTGFTDLCEGLAPDAVAELLDELFDRMTEVIHARGGVVDKFLGDAVMALFGALDARGDDPAQAVEAALDLGPAVERIGADRGRPLSLSVGVATGEAFVGVVGSVQRTFTALGDTVNTAARLEKLAAPGEVVVSEATWERLGAGVQGEPLGEVPVKGKAELLRPVRVRRGGPAARSGGLVARERLLEALDAELDAGGRVLLTGAPGSGRTALLGRLRGTGTCLEAAGRAGLPPGDLLSRLLASAGLEAPRRPEAAGLILRRLLADRSGPIRIVTDDLELAAPEDVAILGRCISDAGASAGQASWVAAAEGPLPGFPTALRVAAVPDLDLDGARRLLAQALTGSGLEGDTVSLERVVRAVGRRPGALVEAARVLRAQGAATLARSLPSGLDALLLARLDNLPVPPRTRLDRVVVRHEAARLAGLDHGLAPDPALDATLLEAGVVVVGPTGVAPASALVQRAVLGALTDRRRCALHAEAGALSSVEAGAVPPAVAAAHRGLAGGPEAARALSELADRHLEAGSPDAVAACLRLALKALPHAPRGEQAPLRARLSEIAGQLHEHRGDLRRAASAYGEAARGSGALALGARWRLSRLCWLRGDLAGAESLAGDVERAALAAGQPGLAARCRLVRGNAAFEAGDTTAASEHYASVLRLEGAEVPSVLRARMNLAVIRLARGEAGAALGDLEGLCAAAGEDPVLAAQLEHNRAMALLRLGQLDAADQAFRGAADLAEAVGDLRQAANVRVQRAELLLERDEPEAARVEAEAASERFSVLDDRLGLADACKLTGLAEGRLGRPELCRSRLERAVRLLVGEGAGLAAAEALEVLADQHDAAGESVAAVAVRRRAEALRAKAAATG